MIDFPGAPEEIRTPDPQIRRLTPFAEKSGDFCKPSVFGTLKYQRVSAWLQTGVTLIRAWANFRKRFRSPYHYKNEEEARCTCRDATQTPLASARSQPLRQASLSVLNRAGPATKAALHRETANYAWRFPRQAERGANVVINVRLRTPVTGTQVGSHGVGRFSRSRLAQRPTAIATIDGSNPLADLAERINAEHEVASPNGFSLLNRQPETEIFTQFADVKSGSGRIGWRQAGRRAMTALPTLLPSAPLALKALDRLAADVRAAPSLDALKGMVNAASAYQRAFRKVKDVSDRAGEVQVEADERLHVELSRIGTAKGAAGQAGPGRGKRGAKVEQRFEDGPSLAELGVDRKWAAQAHRIASIPRDTRASYIAELKAADKAVTPNAVLAKDRAARKEAVRRHISKAAFSSDGPFGAVEIDPPWEVEKIDRDLRPNQAEFAYRTMSEDDIVAFWKREMTSRIEPDCHLFLWTTAKYLPTALKIIEAIGFRYVLTMVWRKAGGFQPLDLPQYNCEFVVYARHGSPLFIDTKNFFCCFEGERRQHSRKPGSFYETIRCVTGGSRIDVFSREPRDGFAQYGDECGKFTEAAE